MITTQTTSGVIQLARKPQRPCREFGCNKLTRETYCDTHKWKNTHSQMSYDRYARPKHTVQFYQSTEWQRVRKIALERDHYLCQKCLKSGRLQRADVVHHIEEVREVWEKRFDVDNLESLCHLCHNRHHKRTSPQG